MSQLIASPAIAEPERASVAGSIALYAATVFTGAFLLFELQPLIAKMILPWFGGSAAVWTTCMLFFQLVLLGGYVYAHWTTHHLPPRVQAMVHVALLTASLLWAPAASAQAAATPAAAASAAAANAQGTQYSAKGADTCLECHDADNDTATFVTAGIFKNRHAHRGNARGPFGPGGPRSRRQR